MSFSIAFLDEPLSYPYDDPQTPAAYGLLTLGDHQEVFCASLYEWRKEDYESQWRHALRTLLSGRDRAALIVEYLEPEVSTKLEWWPMYIVGETMFVQNHFLFYDQLTKPFSVQNAFLSLRDRRSFDEKGQAISEWAVSFSEIEEFARSMSL